MGYVTVSAKIPRRLKELLDKYNIKPGPIIRRALEEEVRRCVLSELEERARELSAKLSHVSDGGSPLSSGRMERAGKMYLFDASAIVNLVKRGSLKPLGWGASLDLAVYEALNAVWKEHRLRGCLDSDAARALAGILRGAFGVIPLGSIRGLR